MSEELKACWMCGSPAIKYWEGDSNCACGNKDCYLYMDFMPIERWNKRFIEDALRTELDACKSVLADAETQRDMNGAEIDTLLKQLYDARYEANLANRGFETIEKQDADLREQVNALAEYIMQNVPGEPSQSQGAVDTAIRIMTDLQRKSDVALTDLHDTTAQLVMDEEIEDALRKRGDELHLVYETDVTTLQSHIQSLQAKLDIAVEAELLHPL